MGVQSAPTEWYTEIGKKAWLFAKLQPDRAIRLH